MNYTTITIEDKTIGLKFGMASFRYLQEKFANGFSFKGNELNEIGICHILYSGYYNNCIIKDVMPEYNFEYFIDWLEVNLNDKLVLEQIQNVIKVWSESDIIKKTQEVVEETKKKTTRGKK
jgi:hypothetical protein